MSPSACSPLVAPSAVSVIVEVAGTVVVSGFPVFLVGVKTYAFVADSDSPFFPVFLAGEAAGADFTNAFLSDKDGSEAASKSSSIKSDGSPFLPVTFRESSLSSCAVGSTKGGMIGSERDGASRPACSRAAMTLGMSGRMPSSSSFATYGEISSLGLSGAAAGEVYGSEMGVGTYADEVPNGDAKGFEVGVSEKGLDHGSSAVAGDDHEGATALVDCDSSLAKFSSSSMVRRERRTRS